MTQLGKALKATRACPATRPLGPRWQVKSIAKAFEDRWEGVFKGQFKATTMDELVDAQTWRVNARRSVDIRAPVLVDAYVENLNAYYETSFAQPLAELEKAVLRLPLEQQADALRAVEEIKRQSESEIRDRIKALRDQAKSSMALLADGHVEKVLDHAEIEKWLKES